MDGNYEWQRFRAKERVQTQLREAERQRMVKKDGNGRSLSLRPLMSIAKTTWSALESILLKLMFANRKTRTPGSIK